LRIAQIAPLTESVPPKLYGGTERVVSHLTEELVRRGHEVTLFASGDSRTDAELATSCVQALRSDPRVTEPLTYHIIMLDEVRRRSRDFDILHFHLDFLHFPMFRDMAHRTLTTLHGRLDRDDLQEVHRTFPDMPLVSISDDQRRPMPPVRWAGTVYHGLPRGLHTPPGSNGQRSYLAFLGRISPEKRVDRAIRIALRAGMPLKIAAKVDEADTDYFDEQIHPLLDNPNIEFVGEIGEDEKAAFLGGSRALLFPIDWPEPFGLVMIEAMACGTPVIAWPCGSVPEIVDDGVTGFLVDSIEAAAGAIARTDLLDPHRIRKTFEERFSVERMTDCYLELYRSLLRSEKFRVRQRRPTQPSLPPTTSVSPRFSGVIEGLAD